MATKPSHILGMNSRHKYTRLNSYAAKRFGFSKLRTKELLAEHRLPTVQTYHVFDSPDDLKNINWETIPCPFVIKPANGSAGKGILIVKEKLPNQPVWTDQEREQLSVEDLNLHIGNILDGEFSTWGSHHRAIVEEMIPSHPTLAKYSYRGTPDVRVVIFNMVPVMAMVRLPTRESEGKANLDKGALGLGVDLATGITTYGIKGKSQRLSHFPGKKKKVNGLRIPQWRELLETADKAATAAGYAFMGADLFIHPDKGPMVVELNGYPGLSIQLANRAGLKRRLERVEGLDVRDAEHGVKIAQALFAEHFADRIKAEEGITIISTEPSVIVYGDRVKDTALALVNTGRYRSAISENLAEKLGLVDFEDLLWQQREKIEGKVPVVEVKFKLKDRVVNTAMVVSKRLNRTKHQLELGRKDVVGFLIGEES